MQYHAMCWVIRILIGVPKQEVRGSGIEQAAVMDDPSHSAIGPLLFYGMRI